MIHFVPKQEALSGKHSNIETSNIKNPSHIEKCQIAERIDNGRHKKWLENYFTTIPNQHRYLLVEIVKQKHMLSKSVIFTKHLNLR